MSFEAYIANATIKTGKTPEELKKEMEEAGIFSYDMKASTLTAYLKEKYDLGHGHCMGIWAYFKMNNWVADPKKVVIFIFVTSALMLAKIFRRSSLIA